MVHPTSLIGWWLFFLSQTSASWLGSDISSAGCWGNSALKAIEKGWAAEKTWLSGYQPLGTGVDIPIPCVCGIDIRIKWSQDWLMNRGSSIGTLYRLTWLGRSEPQGKVIHAETTSVLIASSLDVLGWNVMCFSWSNLNVPGFTDKHFKMVTTLTGWWFGLEHGFYFSIYWECHHPNWRTPFSEG
jgi:hypothetical protein